MAELPTALPDNNLDWATDGGATKTEPTAGEKAAGWSLNDVPPYDEFNWRWNRVYQVIDYILGAIIRIFEGLPEAIAATSEGELFQIRDDASSFSQAALEKTSKAGTGTAIELIATDGQQLYYTQNNLLVAATANPTASVEELWNVDISAMGTLSKIAADGQAVAVIAISSGDTLKVVNKAGSVLFTDSTYTNINDVAIDSRDHIYVYFVRTGVSTIYVWDSNSGTISTFATAANSTIGVATTPDHVLVSLSSAGFPIEIYDKAGNLIDTHTDASNAGPIVTDGRRLPNAITGGVELLQVGGDGSVGVLWSSALNGETGTARVAIDARFVYALCDDHIIAFDKMTGGIVYLWDHSAGAAPTTMACDGRYLWINVRLGTASPNYLTALPIQRNGGLWRRCGDGSTATSRGKPLPMSTLAIPLDYL